MSQLDLALAANVSARHVSFLETGRATPSREMVLRLLATLNVPMRDQNPVLRAAGFDDAFSEPDLFSGGLPKGITTAIESMMEKHEPFPMIVVDRIYNVLRANVGATKLFSQFVLDPQAMTAPLNAFALLFDPNLGRSFVVDWERTARLFLSRLHREVLARPDDEGLRALLDSLFRYDAVPESFRHPDFAVESEPLMTLRLRRGEVELAFLTTVTAFNAPQNITLEEIRIESYFPTDDATRLHCRNMMA
jgi:transcriptional regulator with XRE-family HTH domain